MIKTEFEHQRGLATDRINDNPVHNVGQMEESLNSVCLNDQELEMFVDQQNNYKYKTEGNMRF